MRARWTFAALPRLPGLLVGLLLFGGGVGLMAQAQLGLGPWEVLAQGISVHTGLALGTVSILVGAAVLLCWIPLRQAPGPGTILNIVLIGLATNATLLIVPPASELPWRTVLCIGGILTIGFASGIYLAADLGPGPRDGLMTGLHARTGWSIARVRTLLEVTVLILGFALGGTVGAGTLFFALSIGPIVQVALRIFDREGRVMRRREERKSEPVPREGAA